MKKVVIIGGGYGGLRALEHLYKDSRFHITLIDKNPYHYMQTETYGYIAGRFDISDIALDLDSFVKGLSEDIDFIHDEVVGIDQSLQKVTCQSHELLYDYLIIAVGAQTHFFSFIEGALENTHGVKNIQRAFEFRQVFEAQIYRKLEHRRNGDSSQFHIAVAGAGLSGVEIAAEMAYMLKRYRKIFSFNSTNITISLIDAAETILPGMHPYIIEKTEKRLEELGVKVYDNIFISKINSDNIVLNDGNVLPFDFVIFTAGIKGSELVEVLQTEKNNQSQVIPDEMLRLQGSNNIFIIGDCTEIKDAQGKILPPTAQIAEKSAEYVAKNIKKIENSETLQPFNGTVDGVFIALGGKYALGILFDRIKMSGYIAYVFKKLITTIYHFGLQLKVNAGYKKRTIK